MKKLLYIALFALTVFLFLRYKKTTQPPLGEFLEDLVVATSADYPPFAFIDEQNQITGFDIDIIKEVAKRLNKKILIEDINFDQLLPNLEKGKFHVVAASLTPTIERSKSALFTKPYLSSNPLVVITNKTDSIANLDDLKDKEIVVIEGYFADIYMSKIPNIKLLKVNKTDKAFEKLSKGSYAFVTAFSALKHLFNKHEESKFNTFIIKETDEQDSLAISPKYPILLTQIQKVLDGMFTDGTLESLKQKWKVL